MRMEKKKKRWPGGGAVSPKKEKKIHGSWSKKNEVGAEGEGSKNEESGEDVGGERKRGNKGWWQGRKPTSCQGENFKRKKVVRGGGG